MSHQPPSRSRFSPVKATPPNVFRLPSDGASPFPSAPSRTVVVGTGATVSSVLKATLPFGLHAPSGTCSTVGAGGFTSGGGIGWTSRLVGLSVDNVLGATVVLVNGSVVHATPSAPLGGELLWALAGGGGGNFGLVTEWTMALHPIPPVLLYFEFAFPWGVVSNASSLYASLFDEPRFCAYLLFVFDPDSAAPAALVQGIWVGDLGEGQSALAAFTALAQAANTTGHASASIVETDYLTAERFFEGPLGTPTLGKQSSVFLPQPPQGQLAAALSDGALEVVRAALVSAPPDVANQSAVYVNMMGGAINTVAADATPFPHRAQFANWVIDAHWVSPSTTPAALAWVRSLYREMQVKGYTPAPGSAEFGVYANYQDAELVQFTDAYYGPAGYARLQAVKRAVDPRGRLSFPQGVVG